MVTDPEKCKDCAFHVSTTYRDNCTYQYCQQILYTGKVRKVVDGKCLSYKPRDEQKDTGKSADYK